MRFLKCQICDGELKMSETTYGRSVYCCRYCGTTYEERNVEQLTDQLQRIRNVQKQEQVGALKHLLYEEIHNKKYADSTRIVSICRDIRELVPDDYIATFFEKVNSGQVEETCRLLAEFDMREYGYAVDAILDFMLKSVEMVYLLPISNLIEIAYKSTDLTKYNRYATALSQEAERMYAGVYSQNLPRDVFVCYSSKDMPKVMELVNYLEGEGGLTCFVAARNLKHGVGAVQNYAQAIQTAIDYCTIVLYVSSAESRKISCDAVRLEMPYIRKSDMMRAPADCQHDYAKMPAEYKKPRVEYLLTPYTGSVTEKAAREFFAGNEWCYSAESVLERILDILGNGWTTVNTANEVNKALDMDELMKQIAERQEAERLAKEEAERQKKATADAEAALIAKAEAERMAKERAVYPMTDGLVFELLDDGTYGVKSYNGDDTEVIIPAVYKGKAVTTIIHAAFFYNVDSHSNRNRKCNKVMSIKIPDSVKSIEEGAFFNCFSLRSINIPDGITTIEESVFESCNSLTGIRLPNKLKTIKEAAFYSCESLKSIEIPESVVSIEKSAFEMCGSLKSVNLPNGLKTIGERAFCDCSSLKSIDIPNGVSKISDSSFFGCKDLKSFTIPKSVKCIEYCALFDVNARIVVRYAGTMSQWYKIDGNDELSDINVNCTDGIVESIW